MTGSATAVTAPGSGAASSTIRRTPAAVSPGARTNLSQYSASSPVTRARSAIARPSPRHADSPVMPRAWRRTTDTTRSVMTAAKTGAAVNTITDRGEASSAAR